MTNDRTCTKCGKTGLTGRNRVHNECLSAQAVSMKLIRAEVPLRWYDDDRDEWVWEERMWMDALCGARDYTAATPGTRHRCDDDECVYTQLSASQEAHTDDVTVEQLVGMRLVPSCYESAFPEVRFRARGESAKDEDEIEAAKMPADRRAMLDEIAEYEAWLPADRYDAALGTRAFARNQGSAEERTAAALDALRFEMDLFWGLARPSLDVTA